MAGLVVVALVVVSLAIHLPGLHSSPARQADEGAYAARAWSVARHGELTPWPYDYDHPPLGWIMVGGWYRLRSALVPGSTTGGVAAGRELVVGFQAVSTALLYFLARALGTRRWGSVVAALLFLLSPLSALTHRFLLLDNLGMPLLLGAILAGRRLRDTRLGPALSGALLGAAVLIKATNLLLAPALALLLVGGGQSVPGAARTAWHRLAAAGGGLITVAAAWPLYAVFNGALVAGPGQPSLLDGIHFQLLGRGDSGSVLDPTSDRRQLLAHWLRVDPYLLGLGTAAAGAAALLRPLRPLALAMAVLVAGFVRPGYVPAMYVLLALPLAALAVAALADRAWRCAVGSLRGRLALVAAALTALVAVLPGWLRADGELAARRGDLAYGRAAAWLRTHVPDGAVVVVDEAIWLDVVEVGLPREHVVLFRELDRQRPRRETTPDEWRAVSYVVVTPSLRRAVSAAPPGELARTRKALAGSRVVERIRSGGVFIDVRQLRSHGRGVPPNGDAGGHDPSPRP